MSVKPPGVFPTQDRSEAGFLPHEWGDTFGGL